MNEPINETETLLSTPQPDGFTVLCNVTVSKEQAREVLRSLAATLLDAIETEKYNVAYNIVLQDSKFVDLLNRFNEDFETNQIKSFIDSVEANKNNTRG